MFDLKKETFDARAKLNAEEKRPMIKCHRKRVACQRSHNAHYRSLTEIVLKFSQIQIFGVKKKLFNS